MSAAVSCRTSPIIVFRGPSITLEEARRFLPSAEFRPPIRRGDLERIEAGRVVAIIDGVFEQDVAVSPREVHDAIARGVFMFGSSSMGALRAAEVRGVVGVGKIYELFRSGELDRDDEVALLFDDENHRAITEPLVNIRFAVDTLVRQGTLTASRGERILAAARKLHYGDRVIPAVLRDGGVDDALERQTLAAMFRDLDLKREDARLLLDRLRNLDVSDLRAPSKAAPASARRVTPAPVLRRLPEEAPADAPVFVWETGDRISFEDLVRFLKLTGSFVPALRDAVARFALEGNELEVPNEAEEGLPDAEVVLRDLRQEWGWNAAEELSVTLADLGFGNRHLQDHFAEEAAAQRTLAALARNRGDAVDRALRFQLLCDDLALKRAVMRAGALSRMASRASDAPLTARETDWARSRVAALSDDVRWLPTVEALARVGVTQEEIDAFIGLLCRARRATRALAKRSSVTTRSIRMGMKAAGLGRRLKARGSSRYSLSVARAEPICRRLAETIGVTRVGLVGELSRVGIQVAQAYRPHSTWGTTTGSGKAEKPAAARVGSVMEELEKWSQESFEPVVALEASFANARTRGAIDPRTFDLAHDSAFDAERVIPWTSCFDLLSGKPRLVASALLTRERLPDDPAYSARAGRKVFSTNGLASGFSLEDATLHALCEVVERHTTRLADLTLENPGTPSRRRPVPIRTASLPPDARRVVQRASSGGFLTRVFDITQDVAIPTFLAVVARDPLDDYGQQFLGWGTHPNPEVAVQMAILEAAQSQVVHTAGAREDIVLRARSLGRHERPRPVRREHLRWLFGGTARARDFDADAGLRTRDLGRELEWSLERIADAGFEHVLLVDVSRKETRPARVVRVLIPGAETPNPFHIGPRGTATLIEDLMEDIDYG